MMEYKVCFHISYNCPWMTETVAKYHNKTGKSKATKFHGKIHYSGHNLEEAVEKFRRRGLPAHATCTSMWIMRGREKGRNIKWADYNA